MALVSSSCPWPRWLKALASQPLAAPRVQGARVCQLPLAALAPSAGPPSFSRPLRLKALASANRPWPRCLEALALPAPCAPLGSWRSRFPAARSSLGLRRWLSQLLAAPRAHGARVLQLPLPALGLKRWRPNASRPSQHPSAPVAPAVGPRTKPRREELIQSVSRSSRPTVRRRRTSDWAVFWYRPRNAWRLSSR